MGAYPESYYGIEITAAFVVSTAWNQSVSKLQTLIAVKVYLGLKFIAFELVPHDLLGDRQAKQGLQGVRPVVSM